jgi:hypothetical protein
VGAGAFIIFNNTNMTADNNSNSWTYSFHAPSGNLSDSFRPEGIGIKALLSNLCSILISDSPFCPRESHKILVVSDSLSILSNLSSGPLNQSSSFCKDIWSLLYTLISSGSCSSIHFQFVYSHCGIVRNEQVDSAASAALKSYSKKQQSNVPIPFNSIKAAIKLGLKKDWRDSEEVKFTSRKRLSLIGTTNFTDLNTTKSFSREDEVLFHQLCTGSCPLVGQYSRFLYSQDEPIICRWCRVEKESVDHIFNFCPALASTRTQAGIIAGREALFNLPKESISFGRLALDLISK